MSVHGFIGKIPSASDFVYRGLPARLVDRWADRMAMWMMSGRQFAGPHWPARFMASPVWRFRLGRDVLTPEGWVGMIAGSSDNAGREFPFTLMISTTGRGEFVGPAIGLEDSLDWLEGAMLAFIDGESSPDDFSATIDGFAGEIRTLVEEASGSSPASQNQLEDAEAARFMSVDRDGAQSEWRTYSWLSRPDRQAALCHWWHEPYDRRPGEMCITRGLPSDDCAASLFLGDWETLGWRPRHRAGAGQ